MIINEEAIAAKVEAKDAAGEYEESDTLALGTPAVETPDDSQQAATDGDLEVGTPDGTVESQPAPKFNSLDFGGKSWTPETFAKDPQKWDEFGGLMQRWNQSQTQKSQELAEYRRQLEGHREQLEGAISRERQYYQQFSDPARGPLLLIQELETQLGYRIPDQLKQQIGLDPVRQMRIERERDRQEWQSELGRQKEEREMAERRVAVEANWAGAEKNELIKATNGAAFDLWASYQLGQDPMTADVATERTSALIESLLAPEVFFGLPERVRTRIETKWKANFLGAKEKAARQIPLTGNAAPTATAIGRRGGARKMPSQAGGWDKYVEGLEKDYSNRP